MEVYSIEYCSCCYLNVRISVFFDDMDDPLNHRLVSRVSVLIRYTFMLYLSISDRYLNICSYDDLYDIFSISVIMILRFHDILFWYMIMMLQRCIMIFSLYFWLSSLFIWPGAWIIQSWLIIFHHVLPIWLSCLNHYNVCRIHVIGWHLSFY